MKFENKFWIFNDDDINTDLIFPGKYTYEPLTPEQMAKHAMEDYNPTFVSKVKKGEIIVTGKNFGCGSSREQAQITPVVWKPMVLREGYCLLAIAVMHLRWHH